MIWVRKTAISLFLANNTGCFISALTVDFWIRPPTLSKPHLLKYGSSLLMLLFLLRIPLSSKIFSSFEKYLLWDDFIINDSTIWTEFRSGKLWVPDTILFYFWVIISHRSYYTVTWPKFFSLTKECRSSESSTAWVLLSWIKSSWCISRVVFAFHIIPLVYIRLFLDILYLISYKYFKSFLWCFWYMQAPRDYLSKTFLQCSQDLIPSWLNMPFLQTALLLLTPVSGLTRTSLDWL